MSPTVAVGTDAAILVASHEAVSEASIVVWITNEPYFGFSISSVATSETSPNQYVPLGSESAVNVVPDFVKSIAGLPAEPAASTAGSFL